MVSVMLVGFCNYYSFYNNNRLFEPIPSPIGDDLGYAFRRLKTVFEDHGHQVCTVDQASVADFDAIVFLDFPTYSNRYFRDAAKRRKSQLYLVLFENETIRPDNWVPANHAHFRKVFTWHSGLVDDKTYVRLNPANNLAFDPSDFDASSKTRFCALIASQKYTRHPNELYSHRRETIKWFEANHPSQFDLYGIGWDRLFLENVPFVVNAALSFAYRKMNWLPKHRSFPSYRGRVASKREVLRNYRFSICYENAVYPGYVTEKIFDCFLAGCVPVYWGAPDVGDLIPPDTFIDRTRFRSHESLYERLSQMGSLEHQGYLDRIRAFLSSDAARPYGADCFAEKLLREVTA